MYQNSNTDDAPVVYPVDIKSKKTDEIIQNLQHIVNQLTHQVQSLQREVATLKKATLRNGSSITTISSAISRLKR